MKKLYAGLALILTMAVSAAAAGEEEDVSQAVLAAQAWLAIVDAGKFDESWERAATTFQKGITKEKWQQAVGNVRTPMGEVKSRILMAGGGALKVVKLAVGDVVVIQFATSFEKFAPAIETVTPFRKGWFVESFRVLHKTGVAC